MCPLLPQFELSFKLVDERREPSPTLGQRGAQPVASRNRRLLTRWDRPITRPWAPL